MKQNETMMVEDSDAMRTIKLKKKIGLKFSEALQGTQLH